MWAKSNLIHKLTLSLVMALSLLAGGFASVHNCHLFSNDSVTTQMEHGSASSQNNQMSAKGNLSTEICLTFSILVLILFRKFALKISKITLFPLNFRKVKHIFSIRPPNLTFSYTHLRLGIIRI